MKLSFYTLWIAIGFMFGSQAFANPHASCANGYVSKDGVLVALSQVIDVRHMCGATCPADSPSPQLCQRIVDLILPGGFGTTQSDLISIPHRGAWGLGYPLSRTESENTMGAFAKSVRDGWNYIEVDVALTGLETPFLPPNYDVFVGHYFDMVAVGGPAGALPHDYKPSEFRQFKMRHRDQTLNNNTNAEVMLIGPLIDWAKSNNVVLLIDPKVQRATATPNEYERIISIVLKKALDRSALANIVIKTVDNANDAIANMDDFISLQEYNRSYRGRFLWNPISEVFAGKPKDQVLTFIDDWLAATGNGTQIATIEAGLYTPQDWSTNSFSWRNGSYKNLIDYLYRGNSNARKRIGIWHIDPMSPRGTFGLKYSANMIGNTENDMRGDIPLTLTIENITSSAVTTNRPEVWDRAVK